MPQISAAGLDYVYEKRDVAQTVRADPDKVQQILLNLLSNAMKLTPRGGQIRVSCETDASVVRLQVMDTGPSIPTNKLEAIFDPFVQIDRRLNQPVEGLGLGLAISRELAYGMGGDLTVRSAVGVGSTFTLVLSRATH